MRFDSVLKLCEKPCMGQRMIDDCWHVWLYVMKMVVMIAISSPFSFDDCGFTVDK